MILRLLLMCCACFLYGDIIDEQMQDVESMDSSQVMETEGEEEEMQIEESEEQEEAQEFEHEPNAPN